MQLWMVILKLLGLLRVELVLWLKMLLEVLIRIQLLWLLLLLLLKE
jgi:hypothetical protein